MNEKPKRVVAIADLHCGHLAGLTPPEYQFAQGGGTERRNEWAAVQRETWDCYSDIAKAHSHPDLLIVNGDAIDGRGERSGGTELVTTDLHEQVEMAVEAIDIWKAKRVILTYGTNYHVGLAGEDMEKRIAKDVGGEIHNHPFPRIDGLVFDVKHKITGGGMPHTKHSIIPKERAHNVDWWMKGEQPLADIYLRAHLHFFVQGGDGAWAGYVQPSLQAAHTKFGSRLCRGTVDWGVLEFVIQDGRVVEFRPYLFSLEANKTEAIEVGV